MLRSTAFLALLRAAPAIAAPQPLRSFTPTDFAQFAPRNALDMVERIPGFVIRDESGAARGLGQADANVLLNGQRISGKSNGAVDALTRLPAADVVRLEIVDGASLEFGGLSGQVLNVVTRSAARLSGQFRYSPQVRSRGAPLRWGNGEVSLSGGGSTQWTLSLRNGQDRSGQDGPERVTSGSGVLLDLRDERFARRLENLALSGSVARTAANGNVLNLTGEVGAFILRDFERSDRRGPGLPDRVRLLRQTEDEHNYELGVDYSLAAPGGRLKLIGYRRFENSPTEASVRLTFADARPDQGSVFTRVASEAESIARAEYTAEALGGDWQVSVEGARNWLDIDADLQERDGSGALRPVPFAGASARVGESRGEATVTYGSLGTGLRLQASVGAEYSQIAQSGEAGVVRDFTRPKGFLTFEWQPRKSAKLSAKLERVVGQLDFFDFIASANLNDNRVNVTNANLVPQQSWLLELEGSLHLGALGSLTVRGIAEDISDIVDQIPIAAAARRRATFHRRGGPAWWRSSRSSRRRWVGQAGGSTCRGSSMTAACAIRWRASNGPFRTRTSSRSRRGFGRTSPARPGRPVSASLTRRTRPPSSSTRSPAACSASAPCRPSSSARSSLASPCAPPPATSCSAARGSSEPSSPINRPVQLPSWNGGSGAEEPCLRSTSRAASRRLPLSSRRRSP